MMKTGKVVLNSNTMQFGVVRMRSRGAARSRTKVRGVCPLDPINLEEDDWIEGTKDWKAVPRDHLVQRWVSFFDILYNVDWFIGTCGCEVDEHHLEDQYDVFRQMRELFGF